MRFPTILSKTVSARDEVTEIGRNASWIGKKYTRLGIHTTTIFQYRV